nr:1927_t:CDS:2 [Entrophospora candida]
MVYCRIGSGEQGHFARECSDARGKGMVVRSGKFFQRGETGHLARRNYDCGGQSSRHGRNRTSCYSHGDPYYDDCDCDRDSNQDHVHVQDYDRDRGWD